MENGIGSLRVFSSWKFGTNVVEFSFTSFYDVKCGTTKESKYLPKEYRPTPKEVVPKIAISALSLNWQEGLSNIGQMRVIILYYVNVGQLVHTCLPTQPWKYCASQYIYLSRTYSVVMVVNV